MRLFDGAGPRGLSGIAFSRGRLIRPLPASRRADVLAYLTGRGLDWAEDASNRDPSIRRNRIRHEVLPYLAQVCGPAITESLCRSAALSRALVDDLEQRARAELARLATRGPSGIVFKVADLRGLSTEMAPEVLLRRPPSWGMRGRGAVSCIGPSGASSPRRRPAAPSRWGHWSWSGVAGGSGWDPSAARARPGGTGTRRARSPSTSSASGSRRVASIGPPTTRRRARGTAWRSTPMRSPRPSSCARGVEGAVRAIRRPGRAEAQVLAE